MANVKTILGFIAGASIGAIAGILLAPESGADTRKKIVDSTGDLKDVVKDSVMAFLDKLQKGVDAEIKDTTQSAPKMDGDTI